MGVKHNNPCAAALAASIEEAVQKGLEADPLSIFGGIVALNKKVSVESARPLASCFLECLIAPDYSEKALELLSQKKNLRVLKWPNLLKSSGEDLIYTIGRRFYRTKCRSSKHRMENFEGPKPSKKLKKIWKLLGKCVLTSKAMPLHWCLKVRQVGLGMGPSRSYHFSKAKHLKE